MRTEINDSDKKWACYIAGIVVIIVILFLVLL
jgi:t-SNARE complex subunit (syntaxin)